MACAHAVSAAAEAPEAVAAGRWFGRDLRDNHDGGQTSVPLDREDKRIPKAATMASRTMRLIDAAVMIFVHRRNVT
jgi:hypothetical protein